VSCQRFREFESLSLRQTETS